MIKKTVSGNSKARYQKLPSSDDGFIDLQYKQAEPKIPWKGILMAALLFLAGSAMICISSLIFVGHVNEKHIDGAWPLMVLGVLMFIPGAYYVRIACYAYEGYPGYAFDDIPDID